MNMNLQPEKDDIQENKFVHFFKYDFKNDERFQTGWQKLLKCHSEDETDQKYFKAKLFYYSKSGKLMYFSVRTAGLDVVVRPIDPLERNYWAIFHSRHLIREATHKMLYFEPISCEEFVDWKKKEKNIEMPCLEDLNLEGCSKSDVLSNEKSAAAENIPENTEHSNTTKSDTICKQSNNPCPQNVRETFNKGDFQNSQIPVPFSKPVLESNTDKCDIQNAQSVESSPQNVNTNGDIRNSESPVPCPQNFNPSKINKSDVKNSQSPVQCPQNFSEVMKLIQSGEPIPGIVHIDVEPTCTPETPSSRNRIKKPWE